MTSSAASRGRSFAHAGEDPASSASTRGSVGADGPVGPAAGSTPDALRRCPSEAMVVRRQLFAGALLVVLVGPPPHTVSSGAIVYPLPPGGPGGSATTHGQFWR